MKHLFFLLLLIVQPAVLFAADFFVDPVNGADSNEGSSLSPWKSLQYLIDNGFIESRQWDHLPYSSSSYLVSKNSGAPIKGGDTIFLRSGDYGELKIISYYNETPITVMADRGHTPRFRNIILRSASKWVLSGLTVRPAAYPEDPFYYMISLENHSWTGPVDNMTITGCDLASIVNSSQWSANDWNTKTKNGIRVDGTEMTISHNNLRNVNFGISVTASHSLIERNIIANFAGDGIRGLGDYSTFQYNTIKNCYDVNDNHDDGFQSWSVGTDGKVGTGVVKGIVLRGNTIINYEDINQPFRGSLQGIGCFDGMFQDWIVEKNIVRVDNWHGISLYGAINAIVRDNIVTDPNSSETPGPPWILLHSHKDGTPSEDCQVTCNIASKIITTDGINMLVEHNTLSETGGPRHPSCPVLTNMVPILQLILDGRE